MGYLFAKKWINKQYELPIDFYKTMLHGTIRNDDF